MSVADRYLRECAAKHAEPYYGFVKTAHEGVIDCDLDFVPPEDVRRMAHALTVGPLETAPNAAGKGGNSSKTVGASAARAGAARGDGNAKVVATSSVSRNASPSPTIPTAMAGGGPASPTTVASGGLASAAVPLRILRFARGLHRDRQHPPVRSSTLEPYRKLLQTYGERTSAPTTAVTSSEGGGGGGGTTTSTISIGAYSLPSVYAKSGAPAKLAAGVAAAARHFAASLLELHLVNVDLDATGARRIADAFAAAGTAAANPSFAPNLRVLNVSGNPRLGDAGASALCCVAVPALECLSRLEMRGCSLTNSGALRAIGAVFSSNRDKSQGRVWKGTLRGGGDGASPASPLSSSSPAGALAPKKTAVRYIDLSGNYLGGVGGGGGGAKGSPTSLSSPSGGGAAAAVGSLSSFGASATFSSFSSPPVSPTSPSGAIGEFARSLLAMLRGDDSVTTMLLRDNLFTLPEVVAFANFFAGEAVAGSEALTELDFSGCSGLEHCDDLSQLVGSCDLTDCPSRNGGIVARRGLLLKTPRRPSSPTSGRQHQHRPHSAAGTNRRGAAQQNHHRHDIPTAVAPQHHHHHHHGYHPHAAITARRPRSASAVVVSAPTSASTSMGRYYASSNSGSRGPPQSQAGRPTEAFGGDDDGFGPSSSAAALAAGGASSVASERYLTAPSSPSCAVASPLMAGAVHHNNSFGYAGGGYGFGSGAPYVTSAATSMGGGGGAAHAHPPPLQQPGFFFGAAGGGVGLPPPPPPPPPQSASRAQLAEWCHAANEHYAATLAASAAAQQAQQQQMQMQQLLLQQQHLLTIVGASVGAGGVGGAAAGLGIGAAATAAANRPSSMAGGPSSAHRHSSTLNGTVVVSPCTPATGRRRRPRCAPVHLDGDLVGADGDGSVSDFDENDAEEEDDHDLAASNIFFGGTINSSGTMGGLSSARGAAATARGGPVESGGNSALVDNKVGPIGLQELLLERMEADGDDAEKKEEGAEGKDNERPADEESDKENSGHEKGKVSTAGAVVEQMLRGLLAKMEVDSEHAAMAMEQLRQRIDEQSATVEDLQAAVAKSEKKLEAANRDNQNKILSLTKAQVNQQSALEARPAPQVVLKEVPRTDAEVLLSHLGTEFAMLIGQGIRKIEGQIASPTSSANGGAAAKGGAATSTSAALLANSSRMPLSSPLGLGGAGAAAAAAQKKTNTFEEDVANRLSQLGW